MDVEGYTLSGRRGVVVHENTVNTNFLVRCIVKAV